LIGPFPRVIYSPTAVVRQIKGRPLEKNENSTLSDLCFAFFISGAEHFQYVDYFTRAHQNASILTEAINDFCGWFKTQFSVPRRVHVWTDGGFKIYAAINSWSSFLDHFPDSQLFVSHFAPYHGHGPADSHFGVGKTKVRLQCVGKPELSPDEVMDEFEHLRGTRRTHAIPSNTPPDTHHYTHWNPGITNWFSHQIRLDDNQILINSSISTSNLNKTNSFMQTRVKAVTESIFDLIIPNIGQPNSSMALQDENFDEDDPDWIDEDDFEDEERNTIIKDTPHWISLEAKEEAMHIIRQAMRKGGPGSPTSSGIIPHEFANMLCSCCSLDLVNMFLDTLLTDDNAKDAVRRVWSKETTAKDPLELIQYLVRDKLG
jgi:hypothetical protein